MIWSVRNLFKRVIVQLHLVHLFFVQLLIYSIDFCLVSFLFKSFVQLALFKTTSINWQGRANFYEDNVIDRFSIHHSSCLFHGDLFVWWWPISSCLHIAVLLWNDSDIKSRMPSLSWPAALLFFVATVWSSLSLPLCENEILLPLFPSAVLLSPFFSPLWFPSSGHGLLRR